MLDVRPTPNERGSLRSLVLQALGCCDYVRRLPPEPWQGPFNKQRGRQAIFRELVRTCRFTALVETGTFRGDTALYMHEETSLPVYSVEVHPRLYGFARARLRRCTHIQLFCMDSIAFLAQLSAAGVTPAKALFFYLDAHWYERLPLRQEIDVIFDAWPGAVVMVDDFQVPDDEGYGYDDYGPGRTLSFDSLEGLARGAIRTWVPVLPSIEETGARRGAIVLVQDTHRIEQIRTIDLLREWRW